VSFAGLRRGPKIWSSASEVHPRRTHHERLDADAPVGRADRQRSDWRGRRSAIPGARRASVPTVDVRSLQRDDDLSSFAIGPQRSRSIPGLVTPQRHCNAPVTLPRQLPSSDARSWNWSSSRRAQAHEVEAVSHQIASGLFGMLVWWMEGRSRMSGTEPAIYFGAPPVTSRDRSRRSDYACRDKCRRRCRATHPRPS
jgi:hypothetical protein